MEFQQFYNSLPKFTKFYMIGLFVTTFCLTYLKKIPIYESFYLDFNLVLHRYQIWRLFTNFLLIGKFSFSFLFYIMMINNIVARLEKFYKERNRYAEFVMLLIYVFLFVIGITLLVEYLLEFGHHQTLCHEMLFALTYIESKRDPETQVTVWFIVVKKNNLSFALLMLDIFTGGDIIGDIVGIFAGHLYFYLKDLAPLYHQTNLLITPHFLVNYFDTRRRNEDPQVDQRENRRRRVENDIQGTNENLIQRTEASSYRADGDFLGGNEFRPLGSLNSWDVTQ